MGCGYERLVEGNCNHSSRDHRRPWEVEIFRRHTFSEYAKTMGGGEERLVQAN